MHRASMLRRFGNSRQKKYNNDFLAIKENLDVLHVKKKITLQKSVQNNNP